MSERPPTAKDAAREAREKRLAAALRANLKRRKAAGNAAEPKPAQPPKGLPPRP